MLPNVTGRDFALKGVHVHVALAGRDRHRAGMAVREEPLRPLVAMARAAAIAPFAIADAVAQWRRRRRVGRADRPPAFVWVAGHPPGAPQLLPILCVFALQARTRDGGQGRLVEWLPLAMSTAVCRPLPLAACAPLAVRRGRAPSPPFVTGMLVVALIANAVLFPYAAVSPATKRLATATWALVQRSQMLLA